MTRRDFLCKSMLTMGAVALVPKALAGSGLGMAPTGKYSSRAIELVQSSNVVDMLNFALDFHWSPTTGMPLPSPWITGEKPFTAQDFKVYQEAGINIFALGDVLPDSREATLEWFARWNGFIAANPNFFERIDSAEKLMASKSSGKAGIMLTTQSSFHLKELDDVDYYFGMGQRLSQLCHNKSSHFATAGFAEVDNGLSDFGVEIVQRMNKVGMAVDVSHCSDKTTLRTLEVSTQPILFTHAPCRALNPGYARGKTDEMIKKLASKGGVMGIPILRFMARDQEPVTIEHFLDHIDHVAQLVGIEHVGIGSDQTLQTEDALPLETRKARIGMAPPKYRIHSNDKYQISIDGLNHPLRTYDIAEGLIRRKYSDKEIRLVLGGNFERVMSQIWRASSV